MNQLPARVTFFRFHMFSPQGAMSEVTVIVPHWNRRALLERILCALKKQTFRPARVIVVDNGSSDGSPEEAERLGASVLRMGHNAGFAGAVNRGICEARTEWLAIVNNDVEPACDWLEKLSKAVTSGAAWFAAGKLLNPKHPEAIDGTYDTLCRGACAWRAGHGRKDGPLWAERREIRFAPFTAALFRRELFARVGPLDERFESYLEDVDFGLRCAIGGYSGLYVPDALAYHEGSATLGTWHAETVMRIARNQLLLVAKHYPRRLVLRYAWPIVVAQCLWGLVALRHRRGAAFLKGKLHGLAAFGSFRSEAAAEAKLSEILEHSETEILKLQRATGFDPYWRLYFSLT